MLFARSRRRARRRARLFDDPLARRFDFAASDLASALAASGYRESARTLLLWEGVTNDLTEAAVDATLRWCSRAASGSLAFAGSRTPFASLEKVGENSRSGSSRGASRRISPSAACR